MEDCSRRPDQPHYSIIVSLQKAVWWVRHRWFQSINHCRCPVSATPRNCEFLRIRGGSCRDVARGRRARTNRKVAIRFRRWRWRCGVGFVGRGHHFNSRDWWVPSACRRRRRRLIIRIDLSYIVASHQLNDERLRVREGDGRAGTRREISDSKCRIFGMVEAAASTCTHCLFAKNGSKHKHNKRESRNCANSNHTWFQVITEY